MSKIYILSAFAALVLTVSGCRNHDYIESANYDNDEEEYNPDQVDLETFPDWTEATHSNAVEPDFDIVFPQNTVIRLDITMTSSSWSSMWSDLSTNLSSSSRFGGMEGDLDFTPVWVPCTVTFNDTDWYKVGVRFKGNSSLSTTYSSGNKKLSMKLDFDQYEDSYPALKNQRFHGFKQLNLNNNYEDESLMREKVGADLFRQFGLASANTCFCLIYIDYGSGSEYFGVYTLVEEVDDTVLDTQFADGSGNLYKPEEDASTFKSGTYDESEFNLKTNTSSPDYSDVRSLYDILHSSLRTSNNDEWKAQLEEIFNVDGFMKWLAANTIIQNWDTYGSMGHNYYLYNNPSNGLLTWIPWDNNEAFQTKSGQTLVSLSGVKSVSSSWPLISYLIAVSEYEEMYKKYLEEFITDVWVPDTLVALYESYYDLLKDYAYAETSGKTFITSDSEFDSDVSGLKTHAQSRYDAVVDYLY